MSPEEIFTALYLIVPIVGLIGYCPQLWSIYKTHDPAHSVSLSTWSIWTLTYIIAMGYAGFKLQDALYTFACALNFAMCLAVVLLVAYKRQKYKLPNLQASSTAYQQTA